MSYIERQPQLVFGQSSYNITFTVLQQDVSDNGILVLQAQKEGVWPSLLAGSLHAEQLETVSGTINTSPKQFLMLFL
jgi:hypothetical protein